MQDGAITTEVHGQTSTLSSRVAEEIRVLMLRRRMAGRELARQLRVSPTWVSVRLTGQQEIGLNDLSEIASALGVEPLDLVTAAVKGPTLQQPVSPTPRARAAASTRPPNRPAGRASGPGRTSRVRAPFAA